MVSHGIHMVHTCTAEIKEYDIRAHVYGMVALWWMSNRTWGRSMDFRVGVV